MTYFCFGNGNSRKDLDLDKYKQHGVVVGCNAVYRDYTPDILVALDSGMAHEIYRSGYAHDNTTYLGYWTPIPSMIAEELLNNQKGPISCSPSDIAMSNEAVYHGGEGVFTYTPEGKGKNIGIAYVTGVISGDSAHTIEPSVLNYKPTVMEDSEGNILGAFAYATGTRAIYLACELGAKEVYIIGHDLYSLDDKVNNIYAGTQHYADVTEPARRPDNTILNDLYHWIKQHKNTFDSFTDTKFYKVNANPIGTSPIDVEIEEWKGTPNLEYITFAELDKRFPI